jgi:hypothetical protein
MAHDTTGAVRALLGVICGTEGASAFLTLFGVGAGPVMLSGGSYEPAAILVFAIWMTNVALLSVKALPSRKVLLAIPAISAVLPVFGVVQATTLLIAASLCMFLVVLRHWRSAEPVLTVQDVLPPEQFRRFDVARDEGGR